MKPLTPNRDDERASREIAYYEYQLFSTPKYTNEPMKEDWEIHQVLHS